MQIQEKLWWINAERLKTMLEGLKKRLVSRTAWRHSMPDAEAMLRTRESIDKTHGTETKILIQGFRVKQVDVEIY